MNELVKNHVQYVTFDSLEEGVGASQVLSYILRLNQNYNFTLFSFEKGTPSENLRKRMIDSGVNWIPLQFGKNGLIPGLGRVIRLARYLDPTIPIHARGDTSALAAVLSGSNNFLWDCRALTADQRFSLSNSFTRYPIYIINRIIEFMVAKRSTKINAITTHAAKILSKRYNLPSQKFSMVSTCVDIENFPITPIPETNTIKLLIPGTLSNAYDINLMNLIIKEIRKHEKLEVTLAISKGADKNWPQLDFDKVITLPHSKMAKEISESHFGMSIWKSDLGICLASVSSTKIPEFLSSGRPVITNFNQGDIGMLVEEFSCGVSTDLKSENDIYKYVKKLLALIRDIELPTRCRQLAEEKYSLEKGVEELSENYRILILEAHSNA